MPRLNRREIEIVLLSAVRSIFRTYPSCEWEDLVSQAWLIVTEEIEGYDGGRGASLKTYLHNTISNKLSDYVRRVVLKELNLNGRRVHTNVYDCGVPDCTSQVEAKDLMDKMYNGRHGVSRDILDCMKDGMTQAETSLHLGISRQRVSNLLAKVRGVVV